MKKSASSSMFLLVTIFTMAPVATAQNTPDTKAPTTTTCAPVAAPVKPAASCPSNGNRVTDAERQSMVDQHNAFRSNLTKGLQKNINGTFNPSGMNMYYLEWDCQLELNAQAWSDRCNFTHSTIDQRPNQGENMYEATVLRNLGDPLDIQFHFNAAANLFWAEVTSGWMAKADTIFPDPSTYPYTVGHYTQMAWGETYKVGCGISRCAFPNNKVDPWIGLCPTCGTTAHPFWNNTVAFVVCRYQGPGNYLGEPVYEIGTPCNNCNSTCTTDMPSTCDTNTRLCIINN